MAKPRIVERKITPTSVGERISIDGVEVATIWSPGPSSSSVWAITDDGDARVFNKPTKHHPQFIDTGAGIPARTPGWQAMLNTVIAGRGVVVTANVHQTAARWGSRTSLDPEQITVHQHGCQHIATDVPKDFTGILRTDRYAGIDGLARLHRDDSHMTGLTLTVTLQGRFCPCMHVSEQAPAAVAA